jgi:hypothetical protein
MIERGDVRKNLALLREKLAQLADVVRAQEMAESLDDSNGPPKLDLDFEDRIQELRYECRQLVDSSPELAGSMLAEQLNQLPELKQVLHCLITSPRYCYDKDKVDQFNAGYNCTLD